MRACLILYNGQVFASTPMEDDVPFRVIAKFLCRGAAEAEVYVLSWFLDDPSELDRELPCPYPHFQVDDEVSVSLTERDGTKRFVVTIGQEQVFAEMPFVVEGMGSLVLKWAGRARGRGTLSCMFNGQGDWDVSGYGRFIDLPRLAVGDIFSIKVAEHELGLSPENPRGVLVEFSQGHADKFRVMRAVIEYDGWVVPIATMNSHYRRFSFPALYDFGAPGRLPADRLWLFTDYDAVRQALAQGYGPGVCAAGIPGTDLFGHLFPGWAEVFVNPGSPTEETYYQRPHPEHGYTFCARVAGAVRLEKAIGRLGPTRPEELLALIRDHDELFVVQVADGSFLTGYTEDRTPALMVFTAPDRIQVGLRFDQSHSLIEGSSPILLSGEQILEGMRQIGYPLMVLNLGSRQGSCTLAVGIVEPEL